MPQIFPCGQWITQAWHPLVIQIAELTGPWGVTALLMMVNGAIYDLWASPRTRAIAAISAAAMLAARAGFRRRAHAPDGRARRACAAAESRPGAAEHRLYDQRRFLARGGARQLAALQEESRRLERRVRKLVVWSEGSYPVALPREINTDFPPDSAAMIRRGLAGPVIIGADTVRFDDRRRLQLGDPARSEGQR